MSVWAVRTRAGAPFAHPSSFAAVVQVIAAGDAVGVDVRLAAAVNFKNTVKYRWVSASRELPSTSSSNLVWVSPLLSFLSCAPAAGAHGAGPGRWDTGHSRPRKGGFPL